MFISNFRVVYADTDKMGIMYHGAYVRYIEMARVEAIRSLGISYANIEEQGIMMPVTDFKIRFLRPAHYDDKITMKTIAKEIIAQKKIMFVTELYNEENKLMSKSEVVLCFIDAQTKKSIECPAWLYEKIAGYFEK